MARVMRCSRRGGMRYTLKRDEIQPKGADEMQGEALVIYTLKRGEIQPKGADDIQGEALMIYTLKRGEMQPKGLMRCKAKP